MAGKSLSNWVLPPLPSSVLSGLPARLTVADATAAKHSVTHSSYHCLASNPNSLALDEPTPDYEKLEHVGDGIVSSAVIMLLHRLYPGLKPGPATFLKSQICSNAVLSQISVQLGLPRQLKSHVSQIMQHQANSSIQAALFEAHIGAIAASDYRSIAISPTLSTYLERIFEPIVQWAFGAIVAYHQELVTGDWTEEIDRIAVGAKNTLDTWAQGKTGGRVEVRTEETVPPFTAVCIVKLPDGRQLQTAATRTTKKLASAAASWQMCGELNLPRREISE